MSTPANTDFRVFDMEVIEGLVHPDSIEVAVHDPSPHVPRLHTPDLNEGTGRFG